MGHNPIEGIHHERLYARRRPSEAVGRWWLLEELLERIRDIRSTEKVLYRQVLEIYATSIDYDPRASVSQQFFQKVQNKIHYAIHGHTAAELIVARADAEKEFYGIADVQG